MRELLLVLVIVVTVISSLVFMMSLLSFDFLTAGLSFVMAWVGVFSAEQIAEAK